MSTSVNRDDPFLLRPPPSSTPSFLPSRRTGFDLASHPDRIASPSSFRPGHSSYYPSQNPHYSQVIQSDFPSGMIHPQHHSPSLSPETSASRLYPFYQPTSNILNGSSPASTPTKLGEPPAGMRPRAATVTAGGMGGLRNNNGGAPASAPVTTTTTGSNSAPGATPLKKSSRRNPWGPETYSDLITVAIHSYPEHQATLQQIYDFIIANYEYFRDRSDPTSSAGWKNSIRHNLSLHDRFTKCPKSTDNTKSSYWRINTEVTSKPYVRRRACSIDNANLKRSGGGGGHHQHSSTGRPGSGHTRSTASNGLGGCGGGNKRDSAKSSAGEGVSRFAPPMPNRSPPLPMLCELPPPSMPTHPLNLQLGSENSSAVAAVAAAASSYLGYSSNNRPSIGGLSEDRVTLLGQNMMLLGGGGGSGVGSGDSACCWPSLPSPKSMGLEGCGVTGGAVGQYHYLQQQHQQDLVSSTPLGSFRFPSGFGCSSTDQSFRSRTSGLIEQLLRVDECPSALHASSDQSTNAAAAYLLPEANNNGLSGSTLPPPYFPNSLLVNSSGATPDRRQTLHHREPPPVHQQQHHHAQQYDQSRQQNLPMHLDTTQQQQQMVVRGNGVSAGEQTSSPSPLAMLKQQQHHLNQSRIARSPNASVVHHHPGPPVHQHLRPVALLSGDTASTLSWPLNVGTSEGGVYPTTGQGRPDPENNTSNPGGGEGHRQFSGQSWSSPSSSFMPTCASEDSNDPFGLLQTAQPSRESMTYASVCKAVGPSAPKISPNTTGGAGNTMVFYSNPLQSSGDYSYRANETHEPGPLHVLKAEHNGEGDAAACGELSPRYCQQQPRNHAFQSGGERSCFTSYSSRIRAEDRFFDADPVMKPEALSTQSRSLEAAEGVEDDGVEDCESLELQLSLELADRIVGSSGGR